jgi:hypothetical protein
MLHRVPHISVQLPSACVFDAMLDGQPVAFMRIQIVVVMRIAREYDMRAGLLDVFYYIGNNALRLLASQYAVDEIVLQIDGDNEILFVHVYSIYFIARCILIAPKA